jgi:hypothetical protein
VCDSLSTCAGAEVACTVTSLLLAAPCIVVHINYHCCYVLCVTHCRHAQEIVPAHCVVTAVQGQWLSCDRWIVCVVIPD